MRRLYKPTLKLYVQRCFFDAMRIMFPFYVGMTGFLAFVAYLVFGFLYLELWAVLALLPVVSTAIAMAAVLSVLGGQEGDDRQVQADRPSAMVDLRLAERSSQRRLRSSRRADHGHR